ncbi:hypothetical protein HY837_04205 [archaeon]|nr:hypothetical protein [archaeon]
MSIFRILTPTGRQLRRIEKAIKEENYSLAENQLAVLKELVASPNNSFPRKPEIASLEVEIGKQRQITTLKNAVENYNLEEAQETLKSLKEQNVLDRYEKEDLAELVSTISEEGMIQAIKDEYEDKQKSLIAKHRELYPDSKKRKAIVEDLIEECFKKLTNCLIDEDNLPELYEASKELRRTLEEQKEEKLILTLPVDKLIEDVTKYVSENFTYDKGGDIEAGDFVKVLGSDSGNKDQFGQAYLVERIKNYPVGSVGKLIDIVEKEFHDNTYFVEFESDGVWSRGFEDEIRNPAGAYWKNDKKNVAVYTESELERVELISPVERKKVTTELDKIKELYTQFYCKEQEPVKKRHNPEITEKDKAAIPRSDQQ